MKTHLKTHPFLVILFALCAQFSHAQAFINEIMTGNVDAFFAEHEYPDSWVEINLPDCPPDVVNGFHLGVTPDFNEAWPIAIPCGYTTVYCDKGANGNHTDFRLDADGGSLFLFNPDGSLIDRLDYPPQPAPNIAYGRIDDGAEFGFLHTPTPGQSNCSTFSTETLLPQPTFSHESAAIQPDSQQPFELTISASEACGNNIRLCVTTDGRRPTADDAVEGLETHLTIDRSTVVSAVLISDDALSPMPSVRSFLFLPERCEIDVVSIVTDPGHLYDQSEGIFIGSSDGNTPNYKTDRRRPDYIEYFQGAGSPLFSQYSELRVGGAKSRALPQKSLIVYANKRFGKKNFKYGPWPDKPEVKKIKSFLLRNGGNTFAYERINDQMIANLAGKYCPSVDRQAHVPALVFINGEYYGILDVRERSNEEFVSSNYGGLEDIDMLECHKELKAGSADAYEQLVDYALSDSMTVEGLATRMDMDNFLDQYAIRVIGNDTDWPQNNVVCWRPNTPEGRFRWLMKDTDFIGIKNQRPLFDNDYFASLDHAIKVSAYERYCRFYRRFIEQPELRELTIERIAVFCGDVMHPDSGREIAYALRDEIKPHYESYQELYYPGDGKSRTTTWNYWVGQMVEDWWPARIEAVYNHLATRFGLGSPVALVVDKTPDTPLTFNGVEIRRDKFDGKYFAGRKFTLETADVAIWTVNAEPESGLSRTDTIIGKKISLSIPSDAAKVEIRYEPSEELTASISNTSDTQTDGDAAAVYDLLGRRVAPGTRGLTIRNGRLHISR